MPFQFNFSVAVDTTKINNTQVAITSTPTTNNAANHSKPEATTPTPFVFQEIPLDKR